MLRKSMLTMGLLASLVGCMQTGPVQHKPEQARQAQLDLAKGYLQEGMTAQAKGPLQSILKEQPTDIEANEVMALVFQREMEPELAEKYYRKALSGKREARTLNNYGTFLYEQGAYEKAMDIYSEAAQDTMYSGRSWVFENMGNTALKLEQSGRATQYYERAVRLNARQARSLLELAGLAYGRQDYVSARNYYDIFSGLGEQTAVSLLLGARLARVYDDRDRAASLGLQLKRLYPGSVEYKTFQVEQR